MMRIKSFDIFEFEWLLVVSVGVRVSEFRGFRYMSRVGEVVGGCWGDLGPYGIFGFPR